MNNILLAVLVFLSANNALANTADNKATANGHQFAKEKVASPYAKRARFDEILDEHFSTNNVPKPKSQLHTEAAKLTHRKDLVKARRAPKKAMHSVVIAVKQRGLVELEAHLNDVSNHRSKNYGKHLTRDQIVARTANPRSSRRLIKKLEADGFKIVKTTKNKEYITVEGTVEQWENMFSTEFFEFEQTEQKDAAPLLRCEHYTIPDFMEDHVTAVFNTVQFPGPQELSSQKIFKRTLDSKDKIKTASGASYPNTMTPTLLNSYYNITSNIGNSLGSQALYEALNQSYSPSDLTTFQNTFGIPVQAVSEDINGHAFDNACVADGGNNCGEANLDVQYIMAVSQVTPTIYYYWDGRDFMLDWVTAMVDSGDPPLVSSVSYSSYEYFMSQSYADSFNTEAMKLLAMGATLFSASGDDGVAGYMARNNPIMCGYYPQFPASSPYVVAVGGSQGPESGTEEIACQSQEGGVITTGGGFSYLYPTPAWQADVIATYFAGVSNTNNAPYQGYNAAGRGYPDVTLAASSYYVVMNQQAVKLYGTSASTPVFAGMVALVNADRLAAGKSSLGWIHPSLYALYDQFLENDITSGDNTCVADASVCCIQGFVATPGWDPVTGLGSVNYGKFRDVFFALGDNPDQPFPTPTPTTIFVEPTPAPTFGAGWVYDSYYEDTDCQSPAATIIGFATGVCYKNYNEFGTVIGSTMYSCGSVTASRVEYSDDFCQNEHHTQTYFLGCAVSVDTYYAAEIFSNSLQCTDSPTIPVPLTSDYTIENTYDGFCNTTITNGFEANLNNFCFNYYSIATGVSYRYSYPYFYTYNGQNCKNQATSTFLSSECAAVPYEPLYDDYYGYQGQEVGTILLYSDFSQITTTFNYQFTVTQVIIGITSTDYNNNLQSNNNAVLYAIGNSLPTIAIQNVAITSVSAASRRLLTGEKSVLRSLASTDTQITYTVNYNYVALGFDNSTVCYNSLVNQLNAAIASNAFTIALQTYAFNNNVNDMADVSSNTASQSQPVSLVTTDDDSSSNGKDDDIMGLSKAAFGGVIAAIVVGVLCLCGCGFFFFRKRGEDSAPLTSRK